MEMWRPKLCAFTDVETFPVPSHYWLINIKVSNEAVDMYTAAVVFTAV